ncbi:MAG: exopolysaccharide biosynthesis polyprenyl glycosylphosphotransferase [Solirubrobacteraceae bacterium]
MRPITEGASDRQIRSREALFRRSLAVADVLAAAVALFVCVNVLGSDSLRPIALLALPLIVIAGKAHGLYDRDELVVNKTTMDQVPALFQCATLYALLVVLAQSQFIDGALSPLQVLGLWATLLLAAVLTRRIARLLARRLSSVERCLFVGSDESYERLRSKLPEDDGRAALVGRMSIDPLCADQITDGGTTSLHRHLADLRVHRVIIEPSEELPQATLDFVREAKATGVRVSLLPRILEVVGSTIEVDDLNGLTLLGLRRFGLSRSSKVIKRSFDATGAALGLIALSPFLLLIALLIKLDSRGPVIFRQMRVGRDGRPFEMWKFRTMSDGADRLKDGLRVGAGPAVGLFKIADDPRVTRVGRWLRRSSLDELAQLVNVLRGEMSLVGPRPLVADEDEQITGLDRSRLKLTPGMTGHWQIQGSHVPLEEMMKLDYLYVAGWSLWSDVKILVRTVPYVLSRQGM